MSGVRISQLSAEEKWIGISTRLTLAFHSFTPGRDGCPCPACRPEIVVSSLLLLLLLLRKLLFPLLLLLLLLLLPYSRRSPAFGSDESVSKLCPGGNRAWSFRCCPFFALCIVIGSGERCRGWGIYRLAGRHEVTLFTITHRKNLLEHHSVSYDFPGAAVKIRPEECPRYIL